MKRRMEKPLLSRVLEDLFFKGVDIVGIEIGKTIISVIRTGLNARDKIELVSGVITINFNMDVDIGKRSSS